LVEKCPAVIPLSHGSGLINILNNGIHCTLDTAVNCQNTSLLVCICDILCLCYTVHTEGRCIQYTLYIGYCCELSKYVFTCLYLWHSVTFCVILYIQKGDAYSIHCTLDTAVNCQNTSLLVCICDILCYTVHTEGRCIHYTLYLAFFLNLFILYIQYMTVAISYIQYI
jgi:hypothetical protein